MSYARPPLPPRPMDGPAPGSSAPPPPIPPLPPNFDPSEDEYAYGSSPHYANPMLAPRPHKVNPDLPADVRVSRVLAPSRGRGEGVADRGT
jgi:hypothetical protein